MPDLSPNAVDTILVETNPELRKGIQGALFAAGLREIDLCRDAAALDARLQKRTVDLLICDIDQPGLEIGSTVQRIRRTAAMNPFAIVITTLNDAPLPRIREVINSGADHLICKPMPMSKMINDIKAITQFRRPFVATDDYCGPTRRAKPRPSEAESLLLAVPNTLRSKWIDRAAPHDIKANIDKAIVEIEVIRRRNSIGGMWRVIRRAASHCAEMGNPDDRRRDLDRFVQLCGTLTTRYDGMSGRLSEIVGHLHKIADIVSSGSGFGKVHGQMLSTLGQLLYITLAPDGDTTPAGAPFALAASAASLSDAARQ
jgi:DNA-binding NarL/FixJ family response regulator